MIAVKNVRLIDGVSAAKESVTIIVEDGIIAKIGTNVDVPSDALVVDGTGKTVIPGLIDAHTHFSGSCYPDRPGLAQRGLSVDYAEGRNGCLRWGVTTVRSCGDIEDEIIAFSKDQRETSDGASPRVVTSGGWLQGEGGHPSATVYSFTPPEILARAEHAISDQSDIEGAVDRIIDAGADFIKCFYGHLNPLAIDAHVPHMSPEALGRIVKQAHARGKKVACHVDCVEEMVAAAKAGVDTIEHLVEAGSENPQIDSEMIDAVVKSGASVVPTIIKSDSVARNFGYKDVHGYKIELLRRLRDEGVNVLVGCDSGCPGLAFGVTMHQEMELLAQVGYTPEQIIRMATYANAEALGVASEVGSVEVGKRADFILLSADPSADIANTQAISMVVHNGVVVYAA